MKHSLWPATLLAFSLYIFLLAASTSACFHDQIEPDIQILKRPSYLNEKRMLLEYQPIRILFDYSNFNLTDPVLREYIMNQLIPPTQNYLTATLKVPVQNIRLSTEGFTTLCRGTIVPPSTLTQQGADADLIIFVTAQAETPETDYVAFSMNCVIDNNTKRPLFGRLHFNTLRVKQENKESQRENDLVTTLHEITHLLGFSQNLYSMFINATTGATLQGHRFDKIVNGVSVPILNVEPLTSRLRAYFNCPTLDGAYLENQGHNGSKSSHFERRVFYNEYMTATRLNDARISEFSLALLEGTGWYQVNYSMAEPMTWGKGKGCAFVEGPCFDTVAKQPLFEEYCSPLLGRGCTWAGREGAICGDYSINNATSVSSSLNWWGNNTIVVDAYSDNCPIFQAFTNTDCEDPQNIATSKVPGTSSGYGSKCFLGTLSNTGAPRALGSYCFTPKCGTQADGSRYIEIWIGDRSVMCTSEGPISVPGLLGKLQCPNPEKYCNILETEGFCRRNCMGRGKCVNRTCQCEPGWGSFDCGAMTYMDNCQRCKGEDPLRTSCFGDTCACNPGDTRCNGGSSDSPNVGIIVGAVLGSVAVAVVLIFAVKFRKQLRKKIQVSDVPNKKGLQIQKPKRQESMASIVRQEQEEHEEKNENVFSAEVSRKEIKETHLDSSEVGVLRQTERAGAEERKESHKEGETSFVGISDIFDVANLRETSIEIKKQENL